MTVAERAFAKVNLILRVGEPEALGLHPLCSLFARLELADDVTVTIADADSVVCPSVPGENLAARAIAAFRDAAGGPAAVPPLAVEIQKRIPVAAGLGGGSADAAAVLRGAARVSGVQLPAAHLRALALSIGSDVPSQLAPAHALVEGYGEIVAPLALATMGAVLTPDPDGLSTAAVYGELDRLRAVGREKAGSLDPEPLRHAAALPAAALAGEVANDLQAAALSLRPELAGRIDALLGAGALGAAVSGSGPTVFGLFPDREAAAAAAATLPGALDTAIA